MKPRTPKSKSKSLPKHVGRVQTCGEPMKKPKYRWTDPKTQQAIFADRSAGLTVRQLAEKYGVHANTVSSICKKFAKEDPRTELAQGLLSGCRDRLESKAVRALEDGLDCTDNPYKRGNLGATTLKGLGVFNDDGVHVHMNQLINSVPEEWRDRYLVSSEDLIEADEAKGQFIVSGDSPDKDSDLLTNDSATDESV